MGRPRIHDDDTREALLRAAEEMVDAGGAESVSVRRLAAAAGTTTRAVYSVFGSREAVVRALYREAWIVLGQRVAAMPETQDPLEDLVRTGLAFRWFSTTRPHLHRLAFEGVQPKAELTSADRAVGLAARAQLQRRVERCASAGLLAGRTALLASQFHALCHGLAAAERDGLLATGDDPEAIWLDSLRAFLRGLAAPAANSKATKPRRRGSRSH